MAHCRHESRRAYTYCVSRNPSSADDGVAAQVLAFSATYTEVLLAQLRQLMSFPQEVMLCPETVTLRGAFLTCSPAWLRTSEALVL